MSLENLRQCNICEIAEEFMDDAFRYASIEYRRERTIEEIDRITTKRQCECPLGKIIKQKYKDIERRKNV